MNILERDALVLSAMDLPKWEAQKYKKHVKRFYDDLISVGYEALVRAADSYDPTQGVKFRSYAEKKVRWATQEYLRSEDYLTRSQRDKVKQGIIKDSGPPVELTPYIAEKIVSNPSNIIDRIDIHRILAKLSPRDRLILQLRYWEEETMVEIGKKIGLHNSQVCRHHNRILNTLKESI